MVQSERSAAQLVAGATMTKDSRCALAGDNEEWGGESGGSCGWA